MNGKSPITMNDMPVSVSTRQASELLGAHESSVKRWCNAEDLECWLTPGGHRRIPIAALVAFAQGQGIPLSLHPFGEDAGRVWAGLDRARRENDFEALVELTYGWIEQGWSHLPARLIEYLATEGFSLDRILDGLVGMVMRRVGHGYVEGGLSIGDEHRMTQAMRDVLVSLSTAEDPATKPNGVERPVAVVGCARGEVHELGALMVRLVLEAEGWRVVYLGLNVPTEEFAAQQTRYGATLMCISMIPPMGMTDAVTMMHFLDRMYDPAQPYRLALGGSALSNNGDLDRSGVQIQDTRLFNKMEPFAAWVRTFAA